MNMKTEAQIAQEVEEARRNLAKLEETLAERQSLTSEQRLAMDLHELTCNGLHNGRCDWGNGSGWDRNYEMVSYLKKASTLLAVTTHEKAIETLTIALGR